MSFHHSKSISFNPKQRKKSIAPSCFTCGFRSLKSAKINACKHLPNERAISGTYCIPEIEYALSLGYKILKVFSILLYKISLPF